MRRDIGLAVALAVLSAAWVLAAPVRPWGLAIPVALLSTLPLALRRRAPAAVLIVVAATFVAQHALGVHTKNYLPSIVVMLVAIYTVGAELPLIRSVPALAVGCAGLIIPKAGSYGIDLIIAGGAWFPGYAVRTHRLLSAAEQLRTRDAFSRFVPEQVVDQVLAQGGSGVLNGVRREVTILFCDLRQFTAFSEMRPPEAVVDTLNRYLAEISEAVLGHGGTLISYMGDGVMAVFGAPLEQEDHADRALAAARELVGARLERFNGWLTRSGAAEPFRIGIGLNTGEVMAGTVGSERRLEYTAIGDATNTAARLQSMTKGTPHQIFIADSTRDRLTAEADDLVYVDELRVPGREAAIRVWTIGAPQQTDEAPMRLASPGQR